MANPSKLVRFTAIAVGAVYAAVLYLSGIKLEQDIKSALAYLPTVGAVLIVAFDKWLWKLPLVWKVHGRPRVDGIWRAGIIPDKDAKIPRGGNAGPISAYILVEQSYWSISITLLTEESSSVSRATAFVDKTESSRQVLTFTYDNEARRAHLARSPRHRGACELVVLAGRPQKLTGTYFTDRFTAGEIEMELIDRSTDFIDFDAAKAYDVKKSEKEGEVKTIKAVSKR